MNQYTDKNTLRTMVRGAYDLQKLRIETGNRLVANFRAKLGLDSDPEAEDGNKVIKQLLIRYEKITDGVAAVTRRTKFEYDGVISSYPELCLVNQFVELRAQEGRAFRDIEAALEGIPIYEEFLMDVSGCGPAMSAVIIAEIDITKATYASSLWSYAGLDVAKDGRGRSSRKEHLVEVEYIDKNGEPAKKMSLSHKRFLKTKLIGVLGPSFLRARGGKYNEAYYNYKNRIENAPAHAEKTKAHRHNMAIRYAVKLFLADLYSAWRELEGLPVHPPYHEEKLGIVHRKAS